MIDSPLSETSLWHVITRVLQSPLSAIASVLLPASCALCGCPLPQLSAVPICEACWSEITTHYGVVCHRCGSSLNHPTTEGQSVRTVCLACRLAPPPFVRAVSFGSYDGPMRAAVHALKYDRLHPAARRLGAMLASAIAQLALEAPGDMLVVPVPLHRSKMRQRGFNQARALAQYALGVLAKSHPHWHLTLAPATLMRLRATESQAGLTPHQRRLNVRGAFDVSDRSAVANRHVLLIDDIFTTGATARAAAQSLMKAGTASVYVATLARARLVYQDQAQPVLLNADRAQSGLEPANLRESASMPSPSSTHEPF